MGEYKLKSSTYASIVTIVFIRHQDKISTSIESVIRTADKYCTDLNIKNNLSHMTKYRVIAELQNSGLLSTRKTNKNKKLRLSKKVVKHL